MTEENKEIVVIDETTIKSKIYYIRNQKVMLDVVVDCTGNFVI